MGSDPDRDDLLAFQAGGGRATLAALWQRNADQAWRLARWICNHHAEDALQEAALQLVLSAMRWQDQGPGSATRWLMAIVAHAARKERRRMRRCSLPLEVAHALALPEAGTVAGASERQEQVQRALARLAPRHRQPVELRYLAGLDFPVVAAALGIPERTARSRVTRALDQLRRLLGESPHANASSVVLVLAPTTLPQAPGAVRALLSRMPPVPIPPPAAASASTSISISTSTLGTTVALLVSGLVLAITLSLLLVLGHQHQRPPSSPPAAPVVRLADAPVATTDVLVTPHGSDAYAAFADLARRGGAQVQWLGSEGNLELQEWPGQHGLLVVPLALRFTPVLGKTLIEAVAREQGLQVSWLHQDRLALLYRGATAAEVDRLRQDLASAEIPLRAAAAWRGGWLADPRTVPLLSHSARDGHAEVARQAVLSLRRLRWDAVEALDPATIPLARLDQQGQQAPTPLEPSELTPGAQLQGIMALLRQSLSSADGGQRARSAEAFSQLDERTRLLAAHTLLHQDADQAAPLICRAAAAPDEVLRQGATLCLGELPRSQSMALLAHARIDPDAEVRRCAVVALGHAGGAVALALIEQALADHDARARLCAVTALGEIGGARALDLLQATLSDPDAQMGRAAAAALCCEGSLRARHLLEQVITTGEPTVRAGALSTLGDLGAQQTLSLLGVALASQDAAIRWNASAVLGCVGGTQALPLIITTLADGDANVRESAAVALGRVGGEQPLQLIAQLLDGQDLALCRGAALALHDLNGVEAIPLLAKAIGNPHSEVRTTAIWALGGEEGDAALDLLQKTIADPQPDLREASCRALLSRLKDPRAHTLLRQELAQEQDRALGRRILFMIASQPLDAEADLADAIAGATARWADPADHAPGQPPPVEGPGGKPSF